MVPRVLFHYGGKAWWNCSDHGSGNVQQSSLNHSRQEAEWEGTAPTSPLPQARPYLETFKRAPLAGDHELERETYDGGSKIKPINSENSDMLVAGSRFQGLRMSLKSWFLVLHCSTPQSPLDCHFLQDTKTPKCSMCFIQIVNERKNRNKVKW